MSALRMYAAYRDYLFRAAGRIAQPEPPPPPPMPWRHCKACDVKWRGDTPCWCCGKPGSDY